jgi:hypothetical protein
MNEPYIMSEKEITLEQYKLYVEMADRVSARRAQTNKFYIALLTALLLILSTIGEKNLFSSYQTQVFILVSLVGIVLNIIWFFNILSYRQLNRGKFEVIHKMEEKLPCQCYKDEWAVLGEGKNSTVYRQLSKVESYVPVIMGIPYVLLCLYTLNILFI